MRNTVQYEAEYRTVYLCCRWLREAFSLNMTSRQKRVCDGGQPQVGSGWL